MARASRRRAASPEPVEEPQELEVEQQSQDEEMEVEEEAEQEAAQVLEFDEPLTWRAGRPIPVADLLRRLKKLHDELSAMEQFEVEDQGGRDSVTPKAQELGNTQLLGHKDKGVKAWTLACIVQMFRVLAPNAPYKAGQLREIFSLVASTVIPALANSSGPYQQQYLDILDSLANLRSIVLITDLPGSENLILTLFANCFDLLSGNIKGAGVEQVAKTVQYNLTIALSAILQEGGKPPDGVLDILLAQFLRADPETMAQSGAPAPRTLEDISPAYNLARSICNHCADSLSVAVGNYYSSVLVDASEAPTTSKLGKFKGRKRTHDESENESDDGLMAPPVEQDFRDVEKAHRLLRELWRTSAEVIDAVIPQVTSEMTAENVQIRTLAVQTVGDMIAGIGAAGPPPPESLDPAAYPSPSLESSAPQQQENALFKPIAPHDFSSKYPECYHEFLKRRSDRSPNIRSAWATAAARIVLTSGGNRGLDADQETNFLSGLADMLLDSDEKVRLAAVQAIAGFSFDAIIQKLGKSGGVLTEKSLLNNLAGRIKDPKAHVRTAAIELLARIWGVASGAIGEGSERARTLLGAIPSSILGAVYINNPHINALVYRALHESLLPVSYPPIKSNKVTSQRVADSQNGSTSSLDPDTIRVERILVLMRDLDARARTVFYKLQQHQAAFAKYMEVFLKTSESLHGDDTESSQKEDKKKLATYVEQLAKLMPDPQLAAEHLQKFSKHHDRRANQLIRFCYAADSDYRKITKAMKEFSKRLEDAPAPMPTVLETMLPLMRIVSILVFNQSHVTPMGNIARTNEKDLSSTAHELLQEISTQRPEAFKVQAKEYVQTLKKQAPTATTPNDPEAVEILKSCAHFAQRSPNDMPKDRDFYEAMSAFALHGSPPKASKHAITVIASSASKKDMYANDILKQCLETAEYGAEHFLSKLAAISQICLLMSGEVQEQSEEAITALVIGKILRQVRTPAEENDLEWTEDIDSDLASKLWALKILVNNIRGRVGLITDDAQKSAFRATANPVYKLLNTLIENEGELSKTTTTPKHHRSQMRLAAAVQLLKLCCDRTLHSFFSHADFNRLAKVAQDPLPEVRAGFVRTVKKYLGQGKLPQRFYGLVFMYAFEPSKEVKESTTTWLKARAAMAGKGNDPTMVQVFVRFLSLLAHHQDFSKEAGELEDFVEYIMFYLKCVATESNIPLIYHLAQRVKTVQDGIDQSKTENLYVLSDLAQAIIKRFQEEKGWSLQVYPSKVRIPAGPFAPLADHQTAQEISEKRYLPDELDEDVIADLVRASLRPKKRKAEGTASKQPAKKTKPSASAAGLKKTPARKVPKPAKTPKKKIEDTIPESERRKSARVSTAKSYVEQSDSDEDEPDNEEEGEIANEDVESDTPPSSHPTPAAARAPPPASSQETKKRGKQPQRAPTRRLPTRGGRRNGKAEDSDEELSDAPSDLEA